MIVCDLDGTLLNGRGVITAETAAALRQAEAVGVEVVFATGRRHNYAWEALEGIGLRPETVLISSNGAVTRTMAGQRIRRVSLPVAAARLLCARLADFRGSLVLTFERNGPGALVVEDRNGLHPSMARWLQTNAHEILIVSPIERALDSGEQPIQAMVCGSVAGMAAAIGVLEQDTPEARQLRGCVSIHRTEYAERDLCIVDLLPIACSKGDAVAHLAVQRGIQASEIAAIGDNGNDADMLAFAGHAVVMQNSTPELLAMASQHGWTITASNDQEGAATAILRLLQGKLELCPSSPDAGRQV